MIRLCAPTDEAGYTFDEAINSFKRNRIHLAEIRDINNKNVLELNTKEAQKYNKQLNNNGIKVWSISSPLGKRDFSVSMEEFKKRVKLAIEMCKAFETNNLRVFSFFNHNNNVNKVIDRLQYIVNESAKDKINVALENEKGSYAETLERTLELLDKVKGLKFVYDSSNFIQKGEPSDKTLQYAFPRAYFVHFKDGIHVNDDADITPVGKGEANIEKMINMVNKDMVFSLEHHLMYAQLEQDYDSIRDNCDYTYETITDAFNDACLNARIMFKNSGWEEISEGDFERLR